jgi:molybdenum cofactor guanylyltransferase
MRIAGAIIAGGAGTRMGGVEKLLMPFGARLMIDRVLDVAKPQVDVLALNVRDQSRNLYETWTAKGLDLIHDPYSSSIGPLGGVVAGLDWLTGLGEPFEWLATFPGDSPFLPRDMVARLFATARAAAAPAFAHDGERIQSLCALWPSRCLGELKNAIESGEVRSVQRALSQLQCVQVNFEDRGMFMNINTLEDLDCADLVATENSAILFEFEKDFVASLRCIPMAVRLKLDQSGIKLSLRQWSRFSREDRAELLNAPCGVPSEVADYRIKLIELVSVRASEIAKDIAVEASPAWRDAARVPGAVISYAESIGIKPPSPEQWSGLRPLERFALLKLTRDSHDNVNFKPAMNEFGLLHVSDQALL